MKEYTPIQYIQIDLANHYSKHLNSVPFEKRTQWVEDIEMARGVNLENLVEAAYDKYRYQASLLAYRDAQAGKPIGYVVGLDANASGIAILGALTGCEVTSRNTGIIGDEPSDIYRVCTTVMNRLVEGMVDVPREDVKGALMPSYYGSKAQPKAVFGEDTDEYYAFQSAAETVAPGANVLKNLCLGSWQSMALSHDADMPDGFHMHMPVVQTMESKLEIDELDHTSIKMLYKDNVGTEQGLSLVANLTHGCDSLLVRETGRRCNYDVDKLNSCAAILKWRIKAGGYKIIKYTPVIEQLCRKHVFMSLVGIEHITEKNVYDFSVEYCKGLLYLINKTLLKPSYELLFIHDEFLNHPNYCNYTRQVVIDILAEMADSRIASCLLSQITGTEVEVPKFCNDLGDQIRQGGYIIS